MAPSGLRTEGNGRTAALRQKRDKSSSLTGRVTGKPTMWVLWNGARTASSTPWRATLEMRAGSGATLSGAAPSTAMASLPIKIGQKKNRGAYSSVSSFALHNPFTVASITESSLSSNRSREVSKRLRTELLAALLSVCIYSSTEMSNIVIS